MKIYLEGGRVTRIDGGERSVRREWRVARSTSV
jgi:hypothetical protein